MTDESEQLAALEGVLFVMGGSVELTRLAGALEITVAQVTKLCTRLKERLDEQGSGLQLLFLEDNVQLASRPSVYPYLIKVAAQPKKPHLTGALMETLAIIAYKQPVTRMDVERIRGVKSDHAVNRLIEYGLIEEAGRLEAPGRPILFATTEEFLRCFGVSSVADLPEANANEVEEFRKEAEQEVPVEI